MTFVYVGICLSLWKIKSTALESIDEKIQFVDFILQCFISYIGAVGTLFIGLTVYEQIKLNKLTEKQLEIQSMPIVQTFVKDGGGAVGIRNVDVICKNIGPSFYYISGFTLINKNKYLEYWYDVSSQFVPTNGELKFTFTFKGEELMIKFANQELILNFKSLDAKVYCFKFGFDLLGETYVISSDLLQ